MKSQYYLEVEMNRRKKKALELAEREEFVEKKSRLSQALTQKLWVKYCKEKKGLRKNHITEASNDFFEKHPSLVKVTSLRDVGDLENEIVKCLEDFIRKDARKEASVGGELKTKKAQKASRALQEQHHDDNIKCLKADENPWTMIETFQILELGESKRKSQQTSELKKKKMAEALNDQIKLKEKEIQLEKAEDDRFVKFQQNSIKKWEEEQRLHMMREKSKAEQLKKVRQDQIEQSSVRRKKQFEATRAEELKEMQEISKALVKEEEDRLQKKVIEREKWERIKEENAKKLEVRRLRKLEEAKIDAQLMADMKARMDLQEAKRAKAMEARSSKLEANAQILTSEGAFNHKEREMKEEQSLLRATQAREKAQSMKDSKKKEALKMQNNLILESNKKIVMEKRRKEKALEQEKEAYAALCAKEVEALQKEQEAKKIKQAENKLNYRKILKDQMEEHKKHQLQADRMTSVERSMNKKIIEDAQAFLTDHVH